MWKLFPSITRWVVRILAGWDVTRGANCAGAKCLRDDVVLNSNGPKPWRLHAKSQKCDLGYLKPLVCLNKYNDFKVDLTIPLYLKIKYISHFDASAMIFMDK